METDRYDVIVVGGGNAAMCAALSARQEGMSVLVLEAAPTSERGGNSSYTGGAFRFPYDGVEDLRQLVPELTDEEIANTDFGSYTQEQYLADIAELSEYRTDPDLAEILVRDCFDAMRWLRTTGVRFVPMYVRQSFTSPDGRVRFWGGLTIEVSGGGAGLVESLYRLAERDGIDIWYQARAVDLREEAGRGVTGVVVDHPESRTDVRAGAVVLACGGFEANTEWRARYLGAGWDLSKVRGTRYNQGDGLRMALAIGAEPYGQWNGAHSVAWDMNAPRYGDLAVADLYQKHSYPYGIMVNNDGKRFVDEGFDFRSHTYAKYGRLILGQPGQVAWQVFDAKVAHLLRDEYRIRQVTRAQGDTLEGLATRMEGVDAAQLVRTIEEFNRAVDQTVPFDPSVKDGRGTQGLAVPKSNWANSLDTPPYEAYGVTNGITFTYGGLHVDGTGAVLKVDQTPIRGLYAAGEMVGGLFAFNYPSGSGLSSGLVFGRRAGRGAAAWVAAA